MHDEDNVRLQHMIDAAEAAAQFVGHLEQFEVPVRGRMPRHFSSAQALEK